MGDHLKESHKTPFETFLVRHQDENHGIIENHHCKSIFKDKTSFINHMRKNHESMKKRPSGRTLSERSWVVSMLCYPEYLEESRFEVPTECMEIIGNYCQSCDKTYSEEGYFLDHIEERHEDISIEVTDKITHNITSPEKKVSSVNIDNVENRSIHEIADQYCHTSFDNENIDNVENRSIQEITDQYCHTSFDNEKQVIFHLSRYHKHYYRQCEASFEDKISFIDHLKESHETPF